MTEATVSIRLAEERDVPAMLALSNDAALRTPANFAVEPETLEAWLGDWRSMHETHPWLVATDAAGIVLGFARASPWKGRCAYAHSVEVTVYIDPDHHRRGIGRALYAGLFSLLRRQGYHSVLAGITLPNPASVRLHESFGLTHVGVFERIGWKFGRWHDVGYWQGSLHPGAPEPTPVRPVRIALGDDAAGR